MSLTCLTCSVLCVCSWIMQRMLQRNVEFWRLRKRTPRSCGRNTRSVSFRHDSAHLCVLWWERFLSLVIASLCATSPSAPTRHWTFKCQTRSPSLSRRPPLPLQLPPTSHHTTPTSTEVTPPQNKLLECWWSAPICDKHQLSVAVIRQKESESVCVCVVCLCVMEENSE